MRESEKAAVEGAVAEEEPEAGVEHGGPARGTKRPSTHRLPPSPPTGSRAAEWGKEPATKRAVVEVGVPIFSEGCVQMLRLSAWTRSRRGRGTVEAEEPWQDLRSLPLEKLGWCIGNRGLEAGPKWWRRWSLGVGALRGQRENIRRED